MRTPRRLLALGVLAMVGVTGLVMTPPGQAQPPGAVLVDETFTGATAPEFDAVGTACLTGAAAATDPPPVGSHPLGGCPAVPDAPVPQPPTGAADLGYLQLTDATRDQAGAVLARTPIPSGQGVEISFEQWQYGSTSAPPIGGAGGADGISFFLVDGAAELDAPGAFGGSLGYAQKQPDDNPANPFLPGVNHGFLGIGLDVLGNYFGDWERRGEGCETGSPAGDGFLVPAPGSNMVTVRGPGNGTIGYCFLTATTSNFSTTGPWPSTLPGLLRGPLATLPASPTPAIADALLEPSRRTVTVRITPAPDPEVTVSVDFNDGLGAQQVLAFDAPSPVPASYKFGFGGSTGLWTDVHLIRKLRVTSIDPLPALNLVKQVRVDPPLPEVLGVGDEVTYQYTVTNSGNTPLTDLAVTDSKVSGISCATTTLAPGQTTVCTGTYVITAEDVIAGEVTNVATATGTGPEGPVTSPESTVTVPIGGETGLALTKDVDSTEPYRPGETASYTYTVTNLGDEPVTGLEILDDRLTDVVCEATELAPAGTDGDSTTCTASYLVLEADADAGTVTNSAVALGNDGALRSEPARATIEVVGPKPPPTTTTHPTTTHPTTTTTHPTTTSSHPTHTSSHPTSHPTTSSHRPHPQPKPVGLAQTGASVGTVAIGGLVVLVVGLTTLVGLGTRRR